MTHAELVKAAERWLYRYCCCGVVFAEMVTLNREIPDAIGWRHSISILVEAKTTRSDFLADAKKPFRAINERGMGNWRFYLCEPGVLVPADIPEGWGLLYATGREVQIIHGGPEGNAWYTPPHEGNKRAEMAMMYSALRRLKKQGIPMTFSASPPRRA